MSKWNKVIEDEQTSWWHETFGGIFEADGKYVAEMPFVKVFSFGPFDSLEKAQEVLENNERVKKAVELAVETLNLELQNEK